jgi:hypothetical protein
MMTERYWLKRPRNKQALLETMMRMLAGPESFVSVEGNLSDWQLNSVPCIANEARASLQRQTRAPILDFAILPLRQDTFLIIHREVCRLGFKAAIEHLQIEKDGKLAFGACDGFHPECVFVSETVPAALLDDLVRQGLIGSYARAGA